jgi:hypothetical protein
VKTGYNDETGGTSTLLADGYQIDTSWHLLAGTYDGQYMRLLVDGQQVADTAKTGDLGVNNWKITVGNQPDYNDTTRYSMDGELDEIRILSTARSANWLRTEWYNQNGSVQFYTIGDDSCESEYKDNKCLKITIDHNKVESNHSDFPLLVRITSDDIPGDLKAWHDLRWVNSGGFVENEFGYDITFKDANCNTLPHEVESYNKDTGELVAWVRTDLSSSADSEIYMYYANPYIDCPTEDPTGVWNSNYRAVYHLHDDFEDSTSNDRDGNPSSGVTFATGKIGNGASFDPTNGYDYIDLGDWSVYGDDMTIQAWVYPENFGQNDPRIISKANGSSESNHVFMLSLTDGSSGDNRMRLRIRATYDGSYDECVGGCYPAQCVALGCYWETHYYTVEETETLIGDPNYGADLTAQEWSFLAGTYDDGRSDELIMYRDGDTDVEGYDRQHRGNLVSNGWDVWIGANPVGSSSDTYSWFGVLDEIRITSDALSSSWLETEYNNQSDPSSFYSLGSCTKEISPVTRKWREEF